MAIDFSHPLTTDNYATLLQYVRDNESALAQMLNEGLTILNVPTNAVRWNITNNRFEIWSGTAWGPLTTKLLMDIDTLDGQHGSFYQNADNLNAGTLPAARFNDTAHGNRSSGALHAVVTTLVNGFMSSADKSKLNGIEASAKDDQTASEILALLRTVDGAGSSLNADLLDGLNSTYFAPIASPNFSGTPLINGVPIMNDNDRMIGFLKLYNSATTNITATSIIVSTATVASLTVAADSSSFFTSSTGRYTPTVAGWYRIGIRFDIAGDAGAYGSTSILRDGVAYSTKYYNFDAAATVSEYWEDFVYLNGTTNYLQIQINTGDTAWSLAALQGIVITAKLV